MNEFHIDKNYSKGASGPYVKLIQEWLCLNGIGVVIDGEFGPATDATVREFQLSNLLTVDGIVGSNTFGRLIEPIISVQRSLPGDNMSLAEMVAEYARQHLRAHPREIGGQNKGPWVRYYMRGKEGSEWPWCAGFVSTLVKQACKSLMVESPVKLSDSCTELAENAKANDLFLAEEAVKGNISSLHAGYIFLSRSSTDRWFHTGIVLATEEEVFHSIEGNTNDEGNAEGYEVCRRTRSYTGKDFIRI